MHVQNDLHLPDSILCSFSNIMDHYYENDGILLDTIEATCGTFDSLDNSRMALKLIS